MVEATECIRLENNVIIRGLPNSTDLNFNTTYYAFSNSQSLFSNHVSEM